jgi:TetR/AcrR family acrAB operon transcriptional repressor
LTDKVILHTCQNVCKVKRSEPIRRTKEQAEKTKQQLLDASLIVFKEKGFNGANLEDIAKKANVTRGAIAWHFTNKKNLFKAMLDEVIKDALASSTYIFDLQIDPPKKIEAFIEYLVSVRIKKHYQISIINIFLKEKPKEFTELLETIEDVFNFIIGKIKETIEEGIQDKTFKQNLTADFTAKAIYTLLWGFFTDYELLFKDYEESELAESIKSLINEILLFRHNSTTGLAEEVS